MTNGFYHPGQSVLHRLSAGGKLLALLIVSTALFAVGDLGLIAACALVTLWLYLWAGIPVAKLIGQIRPAWLLLLLIFLAQGLLIDWLLATVVVLRLATLMLFAALVTLTTRSSDMLAALERAIEPLRFLGVNPAKVSLALSLAIRFIPTIATISAEVREAQRVRGLDRSIFAIAVPTIVRTLKMADTIADAIDARCYDNQRVQT